jgi:hypothetical protein
MFTSNIFLSLQMFIKLYMSYAQVAQNMVPLIYGITSSSTVFSGPLNFQWNYNYCYKEDDPFEFIRHRETSTMKFQILISFILRWYFFCPSQIFVRTMSKFNQFLFSQTQGQGLYEWEGNKQES